MGKRIGGTIIVSVNGKRIHAKTEVEWKRGAPSRTTVVGVDGPHGFTEAPQAGMIKGTMTVIDPDEQDEIVRAEDATVVVDLVNGRHIVGRDGHFVGEGVVKTNESDMEYQFDFEHLEVL